MSKKYPEFDADRLLTDLIATTPGEEGKWFATAKTPKRIDLAMLLARKSPCDPKTLILAAGDNATRAQVFDAEVALGRSERVTLRIQTMPKPTTRELRWVERC